MKPEGVRAWFHELPLASKTLLLFGSAAALIVIVALWLPLLRMNALARHAQGEQAREALDIFHASNKRWPRNRPVQLGGTALRRIVLSAAQPDTDPFIESAIERFERDPALGDIEHAAWDGWSRVFRFALAERDAESGLTSLILLERRDEGAGWLLLINILFVTAAGSAVLAVALIVFAIINNRLILDPVESLQQTAESVRDGNLDTRSHIDTGDEFEQLAETFNLMLGELETQQVQLRSVNKAMDMKVSELTESNISLTESARVKGEFLASVSHELRTPLNSIIGFAELLLEIARSEISESAGGNPVQLNPEALKKRERFLSNIVAAGRSLLEQIESLLEMAKIEAGRIELHIEPMSLDETCQTLVGLIYPLAHRKSIRVTLDVTSDVPLIQTDTKKFQQVVFNLLSNAVKFTGNDPNRDGEIILRAERLAPDPDHEQERVRVSVIDNGPGIDPEDQSRIFEKFQQVEGGHTRSHTGAGLGLAIVSELTRVLHGEVQLVSHPGQGSMFSVIIPVEPDPADIEQSRLESRFRGSLGGRREWEE